MTVRTKPTTRGDAPSVEGELLARLGLPAAASSQQVEAAYDELVEYLEKAPTDLRAWARREIAAIDEAYALLSDPTIDRTAIAAAPAMPVAPALPVAAAIVAPKPKPTDEEYFEELDDDQPATRRTRREAERQARSAAKRDAAGQPASAGRDRLVKRIAIVAAGLVGVVAIALAGYNLNGGTGVPAINGTPAPEASASPGVDKAQVAELMQRIQADPKDIAALQSLADLYYQAGEFQTASGFLEKILTIDPKNLTARLALGAALFNLGQSAEAEKQWRQVLSLDPNNLEAHYDLGFLYLNQNPPDIAKVKIEWGEVVKIAPDSDIAKTISVHLKNLDASPAPSGTAPAPGAPASTAPAAPAASPAASGS